MCMMQLMSRWSLVLTLALLTLALACGRADNGVPEPGTPGVEPTEEALEPAQTARTSPGPTATSEPGECEPVTYEKPKYARDNRSWREADPERRKLLELSAKYVEYLFSFPGVFAVGPGAGRIVVRVDKDRPADQLDVVDEIPRALEGCEVHVKEEGRPREVGYRQTRHRPLQGGVEVARYLGKPPPAEVPKWGAGTLTGICQGVHEGRLRTYLVTTLQVAAPGSYSSTTSACAI